MRRRAEWSMPRRAASSRRHLDTRVRRLAEALGRVHRLDARRRQREGARVVEPHRVLDHVPAAWQDLVIGAERLEAALLERRPGAAFAVLGARRQSRIAAEAAAED